MSEQRNVFLDCIIHDRLKHIKEIIGTVPQGFQDRSTRKVGVVETDPRKKATFSTDPQGIEGRSERPGGIPRPEDQKEEYLTIYIITNNSEKNSTIMWAEEASN